MAQVSAAPHDSSTTSNVSICAGLLSRELCPYVKSVVGVDISQGVVDFFNLRASNQGLAPEEMKAVCVDLKREDHELRETKFNVIIVRRPYDLYSILLMLMQQVLVGVSSLPLHSRRHDCASLLPAARRLALGGGHIP